MTCTSCNIELPPDAMFCGECGRAVTTSAAQLLPPMTPAPLMKPVVDSEPSTNAFTDKMLSGVVCQQCSAPVLPDDIFCGECGLMLGSIEQDSPRPRDTNAVERLERVAQDGAPVPVPEPEPVPEQFYEGLEHTRIVASYQKGERYILQFSTGESLTVSGTGLVGRSPRPEPGEYFDQLVCVADSSRSVSKTHLEFGQDAGAFWVKDRYSGNGTIVREPESKPIQCHPERRYRLVRGSRVDLGEQFFIVS